MRQHILVRTALILLLPLLASVSQAQSYSVKELKRPSGAQGCAGPFGLSDNGDVAVTCQYYSRFDFTTFQAEYGLNKIDVWRNSGAQQKLPQPSGYTTDLFWLGIDRSGNVLSEVSKLSGSGPVTNTLWKGTMRTTLPLPAGFTGTWEVLDMSPSGKVLAIKPGTAGAPAGLAIFNGSTGQLLPTPPVAAGGSSLANGATGAINDAGQVALSAYNYNEVVNTWRWFWDGAQWVQMSVAPGLTGNQKVLDLNARGQVLLVDDHFQTYTWQTSSGVTLLPAQLGGARLADNGDIVGYDYSSGAYLASRWSSGQKMNLNLLATLPAGVVLTSAVGINARGQILTKAGGRLFLLTPK